MNSLSGPLAERYGDQAPSASLPDPSAILSLLLAHRSVRSYLPDALPAGTLEALVAAAQSASTSSNLQAWSVVAVEDPERRARLAVLAGNQAHVRNAPLFLVWLADLARLEEITRSQGQTAEGLDYLELLVVGVVDAALAAQNAAVALESMGLATVYIGGIRNHPEAVAAELGLPPATFAVFGMCVGYEDPARPAQIKPRLPQAAVLHREQYSLAAQAPAILDYDRVMSQFYAGQGMKQPDWTRTVAQRVASASALSGRDRLAEALHNLGFKIR